MTEFIIFCSLCSEDCERKIKRIQISEDISVQTEGCSAFTIYMKTEEGEQIVELLGFEIEKILPLMKKYLSKIKEQERLLHD